MPLLDRYPALSHRNFRLYFIGQTISLIGGFAHHVALAWLAYRVSGSAAVLGLVGFAGSVPTAFVAPFAGVLGDRFNRQRVLMIVLSLAALQCLALALMMAWGLESVALIVFLAVLRGVIFACEIPVRHGFLSELIDDRKHLPNAIALHSTALNAARFVGPALGGVLIAAIGEMFCFLLNALTLLVVIYLLSLTRPNAATPNPSGATPLAQLKEGAAYAFSNPAIRQLMLAISILGFALAHYAQLMPAAVSEILHARPELVGTMLASAGLGSMLAAAMLASRRDVRGLARWIFGATCLSALGMTIFALSPWPLLSIVAMFMLGYGIITQAASTNMILQSIVDDDKRSRVMAIYTASFIGAAPMGALCFGFIGERIGMANALLIGSAIAAVGALVYSWRLPSLRPQLRAIYIEKGIIDRDPE
jgi:MFS family permease